MRLGRYEWVKKIRNTLPATKIAFSSIVLHKERQNINESRTDFNAKLCNFCKQNNVGFIDNGNNKENRLGILKLHRNRKGNSILAKNALNSLENYWTDVESDLFLREFKFNNSKTESIKNVLCTISVIRQNNLNRLIFDHININSIRNKFDMPASQVKSNANVI